MTEEIYQRPPKKEEIKEFLKKVKYALFFSLITLTVFALFVGAFYLLQFKSTQNLVEYAIQNLGTLATLILLTLAMLICSYDAEMSRYFIYKRYRFGHFSNMMVAYDGCLHFYLCVASDCHCCSYFVQSCYSISDF